MGPETDVTGSTPPRLDSGLSTEELGVTELVGLRFLEPRGRPRVLREGLESNWSEGVGVGSSCTIEVDIGLLPSLKF